MKKYQKIIIGTIIFLIAWYIIGLLFFEDEAKTETVTPQETPQETAQETVEATDKKLDTPVLTEVNNTANGVEVKWEPVEGAVYYRVFYKFDDGAWTTAADVTETSKEVTGLTDGTTYTFTVRCLSEDRKNYLSNYDAAGKTITYYGLLATPVITDVSNTDNGVLVKWNAVDGATKYRVFYRIGTEAWTTAADVSETNAEVTGLTKGTAYTFTVRCISDDKKNYISNYDHEGKTITVE